MKLSKLQNLVEGNEESTAKKIAKQILTASREKFPHNDKKAVEVAQASARKLAKEIEKEILNYNKESTFVQ